MVGLLVSFLSFDSVHGLFQMESRTIKEARLVLAQGFRGACPCQADGIVWEPGGGAEHHGGEQEVPDTWKGNKAEGGKGETATGIERGWMDS